MTAKGELPPLPPREGSDSSGSTRKYDEATVRRGAGTAREPSDEYADYDEDGEYNNDSPQPAVDDLPDTTMLDSVVLPAIASLFPRVSTQEARIALSTLQRAFTEAERMIPGLTNELVNEIVDSVERVD